MTDTTKRDASSGPEEFFQSLGQSLTEGSFVKLSLGKCRGDDTELKNVYVRPVTIKKSDRLSFRYRYRTRDETKNCSVEEGLSVIRSLLGTTFLSGHLFTLTGDVQIEFSKKLRPRLTKSRPTFRAPSDKAHDQKKQRHIDPRNSLYLKALGVTNERGEVRERMGDKWRQINKFVEIVSNLFDSSDLSDEREISVVDMGSGKGYLTFALYDFFNNARGVAARVTGVEARRELVKFCNGVAREAGFERLSFQKGYIRDYEIESVDILIALHACNTATDEAIYKGVAAGASVIVCAPCCHQQIRPQIRPPEVLRGVLKHGIQLEREAEIVTDGLRALLLERSGYETKVFEFISTEHTRKNTMIVGVKDKGKSDPASVERQIEGLKSFYGIEEHHLEKLLAGAERTAATEV